MIFTGTRSAGKAKPVDTVYGGILGNLTGFILSRDLAGRVAREGLLKG
jgi:hypothetical protein